jgi:hypothetical protein
MATASFRRPGEAFTSLEKMVERHCTSEMKMVIARLLTGKEDELDTTNAIARRRSGRDSFVLDRDNRFTASLLLRNTVVTNISHPTTIARAQWILEACGYPLLLDRIQSFANRLKAGGEEASSDSSGSEWP